MSKKTVKIETTYGTMTFKSWPEAFKFVETIASWSGFTKETRPTTVEQAVEYHLAYVEGGFPEVRRAMRERQTVRRITEASSGSFYEGMPRELWGAPESVIEKEWAWRMRAGWLGW